MGPIWIDCPFLKWETFFIVTDSIPFSLIYYLPYLNSTSFSTIFFSLYTYASRPFSRRRKGGSWAVFQLLLLFTLQPFFHPLLLLLFPGALVCCIWPVVGFSFIISHISFFFFSSAWLVPSLLKRMEKPRNSTFRVWVIEIQYRIECIFMKENDKLLFYIVENPSNLQIE